MAADGKGVDNAVCTGNNFEQTLANDIKENHLAAAQHLFADCISARTMAHVQEQANTSGSKDNGITVYKVMGNIAQEQSQMIDTVKSNVWALLKQQKFAKPDLAFKLDAVPEE